ncbi:MAG TPA: ABC-three component system middle component 2 [Ignavibacteriaceae bacterium]|nr:ABC-three component system middle component 2 [Ignavibacteriaceae bacterium]
MNLFEERNVNVFNTPLEVGLRLLYVLNALKPSTCDLQRLIFYDYILLHSSDIPEGPKSIHPNVPFRSTEILVKRELVKKGLTLMHSKQLVKVLFDSKGILYVASDITGAFLNYINSEYANKLKLVAHWLVNKFESYSDKDLSQYIKNNMDVWGGEFSKESLLRGTQNESY